MPDAYRILGLDEVGTIRRLHSRLVPGEAHAALISVGDYIKNSYERTIFQEYLVYFQRRGYTLGPFRNAAQHKPPSSGAHLPPLWGLHRNHHEGKPLNQCGILIGVSCSDDAVLDDMGNAETEVPNSAIPPMDVVFSVDRLMLYHRDLSKPLGTSV
ncbi:hypothetical protein N7471_012082 [Penicillium samsonianum]|uniref:uncharacterized protein n=1 Tax=Penicillium samsonianum TaxID=1882272 RepID=UPI0025499D41|nr:uncharacterized protein N7471_012082 [Penicillium samsonianum]KAJ6124765.1 hypothetical protein N7471_012082 [Penicillium samsonianum]